MGYEISTLIFYGREIEFPGWEKIEELEVTIDGHFVMSTGNEEDQKFFAVRADSTKEIADKHCIYNQTINMTVLVENTNYSFPYNGKTEVYDYIYNHALSTTPLGICGWHVGARGG